MKTLLADAGSQAHSGSVTLEQDPALKGPALIAQLSIIMHVGSQSAFLEEEFGMPTEHGSAELRGVASETKNLPLIAVTSVSEAPQTIRASCIGESAGSDSASIELPSFGTAVVRACQWDVLKDGGLGLSSALLQSPEHPSLKHAISLKTDSVPGSFYAFGFALNGGIGQAQLQPLDFYDPGMLPSTKIVYVGVPVGTEPLIPRGNYSPYITLANFSSQVRNTTISIADSSSGKPNVSVAAKVSLPAFRTKTVRVPSHAGTGLLNTFTINSDGSPGDVQAHLFAGLDSSEQRLELLAKDARDAHNAGDHPWSLENGSTATLLLYNPTVAPQEFQVRISGGGASWIELYSLAPSETKAISINEIIQKQTPDHVQRKLPADLLTGEVQWSTQSSGSGLGRLLVSNETAALARSFSCSTYINLCGSSFGPDNFLDVAYNTDAFFSAVVPVACTEYCPNCCNQTTPVGGGYSFSTMWQGGDSAQTQVLSSTNNQIDLKGIGLGNFSFNAIVTVGACQSSPMGGGGTVGKPAPLLSTSCTTGSTGTLTDSWGTPGCAKSDLVYILSASESCTASNGKYGPKQCAQSTVNGCVTTTCPIDDRLISNDCNSFVDGITTAYTQTKVGCN